MSRTFLSIACHEYVVAALLYLAYLVRQHAVLPIVGRVLVGSGLVLHGSGLVLALWPQGGRPIGLAQGFFVLAFLLLLILLILDLAYRKPVLGAFLTPVAVAAQTLGLLVHAEEVLPEYMKQPLFPFHVAIALLGLAAFGVAAGVACMYLVLERQVKGKRFGLLFTRLPSLNFLDELNRRLVIWGFIALSITLVSGLVFSKATQGVVWEWESKRVATLVGWAVFAVLLNARSLGWAGRRVALITMAGFCILLISFFSSYSGTQVPLPQ
jgi:ABC-type uncharacterized transport system permease subunit